VADLVLGGFQGSAGQQAVGGIGVPEPMGGHLLQFRFGVVIGACSRRRVAGSPDDAADGPGGQVGLFFIDVDGNDDRQGIARAGVVPETQGFPVPG